MAVSLGPRGAETGHKKPASCGGFALENAERALTHRQSDGGNNQRSWRAEVFHDAFQYYSSGRSANFKLTLFSKARGFPKRKIRIIRRNLRLTHRRVAIRFCPLFDRP